jgi:hypothetical protein
LLLRTQIDVRYGCGCGSEVCGVAVAVAVAVVVALAAEGGKEKREEMATEMATGSVFASVSASPSNSVAGTGAGTGGRVGHPIFEDAPLINKPILILDGGSDNYPIQNKWIRSVVALSNLKLNRTNGPTHSLGLWRPLIP